MDRQTGPGLAPRRSGSCRGRKALASRRGSAKAWHMDASGGGFAEVFDRRACRAGCSRQREASRFVRACVRCDPRLTRGSTGRNVPAVIHYAVTVRNHLCLLADEDSGDRRVPAGRRGLFSAGDAQAERCQPAGAARRPLRAHSHESCQTLRRSSFTPLAQSAAGGPYSRLAAAGQQASQALRNQLYDDRQ